MIFGVLPNWAAVAEHFNDKKVIFLFHKYHKRILSKPIIELRIGAQIYGSGILKKCSCFRYSVHKADRHESNALARDIDTTPILRHFEPRHLRKKDLSQSPEKR